MVEYLCMITAYILDQLTKARYKLLDDGTYFGEIPGLQGVWADGKTLEDCRNELADVLESWLYLKIRTNSRVSGFRVRTHRTRTYASSCIVARAIFLPCPFGTEPDRHIGETTQQKTRRGCPSPVRPVPCLFGRNTPPSAVLASVRVSYG